MNNSEFQSHLNKKLLSAIENNSLIDEIDNIIQEGADINANGFLNFEYAFANENFEIAKFLISKGANINAANEKGDTLLMDYLFILIGAQINLDRGGMKDSFGRVISSVDEIRKNFQKYLVTFKFLIDNGADVKVKNKNGRNALSMVSNIKNQQILELILSKVNEN
jgi:ankyrin repeat protein